VPVLPVVPADEVRDPTLRRRDIGERQPRVGRCVLKLSKDGLRVRIVIRHVRPTEGGTTPSHCSVASIVLLRIGAPLSR
jgi:hypothetical protein